MSDVVTVAAISSGSLIVVAWINARGTRKNREAIHEVKTEVVAVHEQTTSVDEAVNHKEHGMPTLVQRVIDQDERGIKLGDDLAASREWNVGALQVIADHLHTELPEQPAVVIAPVVQLPQDQGEPKC